HLQRHRPPAGAGGARRRVVAPDSDHAPGPCRRLGRNRSALGRRRLRRIVGGSRLRVVCGDMTRTPDQELQDPSTGASTPQEAQRAAVRRIWSALELGDAALDRLRFRANDELPSAYRVSDLAAAAVGAAALAISELVGADGPAPRVEVDRRLAALWFGWSIKPVGWEMPAAWDPIAGDYRAGDGWIRLHPNAPRPPAAAPALLAP